MASKAIAGLNGFGRVGLHLLKYWLDRHSETHFIIRFINDDTLTIKDAYQIICSDEHVHFNKYKVQLKDDTIVILEPDGSKHVIFYTNKEAIDIPWIGKPDIVFECSGKNTLAKDCAFYVTKRTKLAVISATSWDADKTLVYGFNHATFNGTERVISYGSCTVNAYVPLANYLNKKYGVLSSDVNVIHNIQEYRLQENHTLNRKFCTLEKSGPQLLPFLNANNFLVNYTIVPYSGVSMIDFRFKLGKPVSTKDILQDLEETFSRGQLKYLYNFDETDIGPEAYNCSTYSVVFIKENLKVMDDNNVYFYGYFDNENSVNRYYDLVNYICIHELFKENYQALDVVGI